MNLNDLLKNKYIKEYGRILAIVVISVIVGLAWFAGRHSRSNNSTVVLQPSTSNQSADSKSDTPASNLPAAVATPAPVATTPAAVGSTQPATTTSLAQQQYYWSIDYGIQGILGELQSDENAVSNEKNSGFTTYLASDCEQLGKDATTFEGIKAAPDPSVSDDFHQGASLLVTYSSQSCSDDSLVTQSNQDFTNAITIEGNDEGI